MVRTLSLFVFWLFLFTVADAQQDASIQQRDAFTLQTKSNVVLVPTSVRAKDGEIIYALKANQFVVEDNGVPQKVQLDERRGFAWPYTRRSYSVQPCGCDGICQALRSFGDA